MNALSPARNHSARPGYYLRDGLDLPGWEEQSIWGWDDGTASFFAQLWPNGSRTDAPEVSLSGADAPPYPWPGCIACEIVERTKTDALTVVHAMGIAHPDPVLRHSTEIAERIGELPQRADRSGYYRGQLIALLWTQGLSDISPGTRATWLASKPTAAQADAEHHMITGRIYRPTAAVESRDYFHGADEALWWALSR